MDVELAPDIKKEVNKLVPSLDFSHINAKQVFCMRSYGSTSRARARIWSFPSIWQKALNLPPYYIIEVLSEKFDRLSAEDQIRVLIHELMHIPKTFSGALLPHRGRGKRRIDYRSVEQLYNLVKQNRK